MFGQDLAGEKAGAEQDEQGRRQEELVWLRDGKEPESNWLEKWEGPEHLGPRGLRALCRFHAGNHVTWQC